MTETKATYFLTIDQCSSNLNKDKGYITPKLTLWIPTEAKYVNVCQDLTISQMLQLLLDKGDPLEAPIIKFMLVEQRDEAVSDEDKPKSKCTSNVYE